MKRLLALISVLAAAAFMVVFATGADSSGGYKVRAIFNNASFVITGEDVKVAGVKVGQIESLEVTRDKKAAVVLAITDAKHHNFRKDASCTIRPQGLIGEKFIECRPTVPRSLGGPEQPLLAKIAKGPGKGQYLLPSSNTSKPIDLDLINNIARLPYRQRLTIILNEFGTGLAGNGENLNEAIRNANPAFKELQNVVSILAQDNKVLAKLAEDGDRVLQPLARERARFAGFISNSTKSAQATAERSADLEANFQKFPEFLRRLSPFMDTFDRFNKSLIPIATDFGRGATNINAFVTGTPDFTDASAKSLTSLGDTADLAGPALEKSLPLVKDLGGLASRARPLAANLAQLTSSFRDAGAIERFLDVIYNLAGTTNGFDEYGHYIRTQLVLNNCQVYYETYKPSCSGKYDKDLGSVEAPPAGATGSSGAAAAAPAPQPLAALSARTPRASKVAAREPDAQTTQSLLDYLLGE